MVFGLRIGFACLALLALSFGGLGCDSSPKGPSDKCEKVDCDDGNPCTEDDCDPETGCVNTPADVESLCGDDNPCTADSCDPATGCVNDGAGVTGDCDDGDPCSTDDACQGDGTCAGGGPADCDDGNPCTYDSCHPALGCVHDGTGETGFCDDNSVCTEDDICQGDAAGTCLGTDISANCDDSDPCTADVCDPVGGCSHSVEGVDAACDDGDPCTAADVCQGDGSCAGSMPTDCDDSNECTADSCDQDSGCVHDGAGITSDCDDGNACTVGDFCRGDEAGNCAGIFIDLMDCDDSNICTVDTCDAQLGCVHDGSGIVSACDDGDACTSGDTCAGDAAGSCAGGGATDCDDGNDCTADACDPASGCLHDGSGILVACDDGSVCTIDDACAGDQAGTCSGTDITAAQCNDGNACTADSCDPVDGCENELIASHACYPSIVVDYPLRGATIQGNLGNQVVTVTGTVSSGAGPITSFTLNGVDVPLAGDGSFSQAVATDVGGNTLVFEATDSMDSWKKRVQAFLWSSAYSKPTVPMNGMVDPGMGIWLSQQILDDGDHSLPVNDFATIFELVLGGIDPNSFFDPDDPIASEAGYNIYLTGMNFGGTSAGLQSMNGGMHVTAVISDITGSLFFDCPCGFPCGCWWTGGDSNGGLSMNSLVVQADVLLSVRPDHTLLVDVANSITSINGLSIWSDDLWTDFLLSIVMVFIQDQLVSGLEDELNSQLVSELAPMLEDALSALAIAESFDLPKLDGSGDVISIDLITDFAHTAFDPAGGEVGLRAAAYTTPAVAFDNLGVPMRVGCGAGSQTMVVPGSYPFELVLADDTLNSLFYAAWSGGLLEFPIPEAMLGDVDLEQFGITDLSLTLSGMLAPTAADCGAGGELKIFMGDLSLLASMNFSGVPMDIIVWASATMGLELTASNSQIDITITAIDGIETEIDVVQDELVGLILLIGDGFEQLLVDALMGALNGGQLASIPLPEMDLSDAVGLPPGTAVIALDPQDVSRQGGNTIISGDLQ
jgi:hypothetical protein